MTTLTIREYYDHTQAIKDIREYSEDISVDLMRQPGLFAYYNSLLVQAEAQHDRLINARDIIEAKLDTVIREEAAKSGTKVTETQIKAKVAIHSKLREANDLVRAAREQVGYLKGTCEALRQRRDTLMQISFNMREELKGSPAVMSGSMKENQRARLTRLATLNVDE